MVIGQEGHVHILLFFSFSFLFEVKLDTYLCFSEGCIEKYIDILDGKCRTKLLKSVYAGIHERPEDDPDLQDFFRFKCWT